MINKIEITVVIDADGKRGLNAEFFTDNKQQPCGAEAIKILAEVMEMVADQMLGTNENQPTKNG